METPTRQVICQFCKQEVPYSPLQEMDRMGVDVYFCPICKAEYLYFKDSDHFNVCNLYIEMNGKQYRWTTTQTGRAALCYIKTPGILGEKMGRDQQILFALGPEDNQPVITPDNISRKIKTILVFL